MGSRGRWPPARTVSGSYRSNRGSLAVGAPVPGGRPQRRARRRARRGAAKRRRLDLDMAKFGNARRIAETDRRVGCGMSSSADDARPERPPGLRHTRRGVRGISRGPGQPDRLVISRRLFSPRVIAKTAEGPSVQVTGTPGGAAARVTVRLGRVGVIRMLGVGEASLSVADLYWSVCDVPSALARTRRWCSGYSGMQRRR